MEPTDQLAQSANEVRLSGAAKSRIRERLVAHIAEHPVLFLESTPSPYARVLHALSPLTSLRNPAVFGALALVVVIGGATTYAAAAALPGDTLYPLKVGVIEPVQGALAFSLEAQATWNASLTNTRLAEVEQLATDDKLTVGEGEQSQQRFDRSLENTHTSIQNLSHQNPTAAAKIDASLTQSLKTHKNKLLTLGILASSTDGADVRMFANHINDGDDTDNNTKDASTSATSTPRAATSSPNSSWHSSSNKNTTGNSTSGNDANGTNHQQDNSGSSSHQESVNVDTSIDSSTVSGKEESSVTNGNDSNNSSDKDENSVKSETTIPSEEHSPVNSINQITNGLGL